MHNQQHQIETVVKPLQQDAKEKSADGNNNVVLYCIVCLYLFILTRRACLVCLQTDAVLSLDKQAALFSNIGIIFELNTKFLK